MENEKWSWFAGGVVLGLLLGLGIAGTFAFTQAQHAQAAEMEAMMMAERAEQEAFEAHRQVEMARREAEAARLAAEERLRKIEKQQGEKSP